MGKGFDNLIVSLKDIFGNSSRKPAIIIVSVLSLTLLSTLCWTAREIKRGPYRPELKEMGLWMKENIPDVKDKRICTLWPMIIFYCEGQQFTRMRYCDDYIELIGYLRTGKFDYLIIDEYGISTYRPQFIFLLDDEKERAGLSIAHTINTPQKIILYKVE